MKGLLLVAALSGLWVDHAVVESEHVVLGTYEGGALTVEKEWKGALPAKTVAVERDSVEEDPRKPRKGRGVFFLQERFEGKGDRKRFIEWEGPDGVAWLGTASFEGSEVAKLLESSLVKERALDAALAQVDTSARAKALSELVAKPREATPEEQDELGPDPFAQRALTEIGHAGGAEVLDALRANAKQPWIKAAAIRALAASAGNEARLEAIALDAKASEDEVVAAVDMLFSAEKANVATLEKLSWDSRPRVRRAVASALREKVKDLATLERLMKDTDPSVRAAATESARAAARRLGKPMPGE